MLAGARLYNPTRLHINLPQINRNRRPCSHGSSDVDSVASFRKIRCGKSVLSIKPPVAEIVPSSAGSVVEVERFVVDD